MKRYDPFLDGSEDTGSWPDMDECKHGQWVRFEDVQALARDLLPIIQWHIQDSDECGDLARAAELRITAIAEAK